jgi:hypothetical protein
VNDFILKLKIMEKNIKDYLHLYLGCECMMTKISYHAVHELILSQKRSFKLDGKLLQYFIEPTTKAEIKPILRPLSDMNDEEFRWLEDETHFHPGGFNSHDNDVTIEWKEEMIEEINEHGTPEIFLFLLSKHFDLFSLIEAGLAIDKTKI